MSVGVRCIEVGHVTSTEHPVHVEHGRASPQAAPDPAEVPLVGEAFVQMEQRLLPGGGTVEDTGASSLGETTIDRLMPLPQVIQVTLDLVAPETEVATAPVEVMAGGPGEESETPAPIEAPR